MSKPTQDTENNDQTYLRLELLRLALETVQQAGVLDKDTLPKAGAEVVRTAKRYERYVTAEAKSEDEAEKAE